MTKKKDTNSTNKKVNAITKTNNKPRYTLVDKALISIFIFLFGFSIIKITNWHLEKKHVDKQMNEILDFVEDDTTTVPEDVETEENTNTNTSTNTNTEDKKEEEKEEEKDYYTSFLEESYLNVNFKELKKINSSTVGWIKVNGTYINYPIVKAKDNDYYLNRSFDKTYNSSGWIYMDYRNNKNILKNKNTIIYGHGRFDRIMFGSLKTVVKDDWFNNTKSKTIRLTTESYKTVWKVFSVYTVKPENYYITTKFSSTSEYSSFLKKITKRSVHDFGVSVDTDDIIITLSSCYNDSKRVVMHAKLTKKTKVD